MPIHAEELRRFLSEAAGRPVELKLNTNRSTMVSVRPDPFGVGLRMSVHRIFLDAGEPVLHALADFARRDTPAESHAVVRAYIAENQHRASQVDVYSPPRPRKGTALGKVHHLEPRARRLNEEHFEGRLDFRICWGSGQGGCNRRQRHVTLGTWSLAQRLIRIHPMLDHPHVPLYFLDFIVYHEMVHIAVPSSLGGGGRLLHHGPEFRAMEARYPLYAEALRWEKRWLPALIRSWNGGAALPARAARPLKAPLPEKRPEPPTRRLSSATEAARQIDLFDITFQ